MLLLSCPISGAGDGLSDGVALKRGAGDGWRTSLIFTKLIKESKLKVQAKIQGNELRISGAKKDNLQEAISKIKELKLELPLQYINFRD